MDLYLIITPISIILTILSLVTLKYSIQLRQKQSVKNPQIQTKKQQLTYLQSIEFLIKNYTIVEICTNNKAKHKIPLLLAISVILILCFVKPMLYYFPVLIVFTISFIAFEVITQRQQHKNQEKQRVICYTISSTVSILIFTILGILVFKDYNNTGLYQFSTIFLINIGIGVGAQPFPYLLIAKILIYSDKYNSYVSFEKIEQLQTNQKIQIKIDSQIKSKMRLPQTRTLQIQPTQGYLNAVEMSKKIKKNRHYLPPIDTPIKIPRFSTQSDVNSFDKMNRTIQCLKDKSLQTPINQMHMRTENQEEQESSNKQEYIHKTLEDKINIKPLTSFKAQRKATSPSKQRSINKTLKENKLQSDQTSVQIQKINSQIYRRSQTMQNYLQNLQIDNKQKQLLNKSQQLTKNLRQISNNGMIICQKNIMQSNKTITSQNQQKQQIIRQQPLQTIYNRRSFVIQNNESQLNKSQQIASLLQINQDHIGEIEEINFNSPQKRRCRKQQVNTNLEDFNLRKTQQKKKKSVSRKLSTGKRVIKFCSGEPYLQYLPNMLNKQFDQNKKNTSNFHSQIREQSSFFMDKKRKSFIKKDKSKFPIVINNNQNDCPDFYINEI